MPKCCLKSSYSRRIFAKAKQGWCACVMRSMRPISISWKPMAIGFHDIEIGLIERITQAHQPCFAFANILLE